MSLINDYLSARGILPQTALDNGFEFDEAPTSGRISQRLNGDFQVNGKPLSAVASEILWIPVRDGVGTVEAWIARPLPTIDDGPRFLSPRDVFAPACVFITTWDARTRIDVPLVITEGPPKGLVLLQAGGVPIALTGVWMGAQRNGANQYSLVTTLEIFAWTARRVYMAFDADQSSNALVMQASLRLAFLLNARGAEVMQLTSWPLSEGNGIDDHLFNKAGSDLDKQKEVFAELTSKAVPFFDTLRPSWLSLVEAELRKVDLSQAQRSQLCKKLAKRLEVRVSALEGATDLPAEISQENVYRLLETIEPWPEPVDGVELMNTLCVEVVSVFIVIEPQFTLPFVLWTVLVYLHQLFNFSPFIRFKSPVKECGKSTALDILFELTPRPLMVGNMSASPLFRLISEKHPAILLDEAQSYVKKDSDIGGILDASYQKNRLAVRTNPNTMETEFFDTFGPKALASIGPLDDTIESRSIIVPMTRKRADQDVKQICDILEESPDWFLILRRKLMRWTEDNKDRLRSTRLKRPAFLGNRNWDKWRPLFVIAHVLGDSVLTRLRENSYTIVTGDDSELGIKVEILSMLRDLFKARGPGLLKDFQFLPTDEILDFLNSNQEAAWADWKTGDKTGLTAKKLGGYLKEYKIKSDRPKRDGKQLHGYWFEHFEKAFSSYLPIDTPPDSSDDPPTPPEPDDNPPPHDPGGPENPTPTKPAKGNATEDKTGDGRAKTRYTVAPGANLEPQSGSQVVSSYASTIKRNRIGSDDPAPKEGKSRIETSDPVPLYSSGVTTYDSGAGLKAQKAPPPGYEVFFDASSVLEFVERLPDDLPKIALDIETFMPGEASGNRDPLKGVTRKGSAMDWQAARIRLVSLTVPDRGTVVIDLGLDPDLNTPLRLAVEILLARLQRVEIIGHRLGFDLCFLEHEFKWRPSRVWDTWVAEELLLNDDWELCDKALRPKKMSPGPTTLENALKRRCDIALDKGLGGGARSDFGASLLSDEQYAYSAGDTRHLFALEAAQRVEIATTGLDRAAEIEMNLVPIMSRMEIVGIPLRADILDEGLLKLKSNLNEVDVQVLPAMQAAGFDPFLDYSSVSKTYLHTPKKPRPVNINGTSLQQHYFHDLERRTEIKLPRTKKSLELQLHRTAVDLEGPVTTKEDQISLTIEVFRSINDPVARLYADREEISALIVGIEQRLPFISHDGRVHPVHNQLSANTGRISTEEPPMSNLPKTIKGSPLRRSVEAPDGYVLVQGDLGLIEVRAQAHFTGDPMMIELFNLPSDDPRGDIYRLFASWAHQCDILEIPAKGAQRNQAKPPVLGTAYLMGLNRFVEYARGYGVELTVPRAAELRALYLKKFAGIKAWQDRAWANAKANRITEGRSHLGRRRLVLQIPGDTSHQYRQAQAQVNYIIQSACADGLKIAIILIVKALPEGAELILTVHDELLVLCRTEQAQEVSKIVTAAVVSGYRIAFGEPLQVPIVFETNVLKNWSEKS